LAQTIVQLAGKFLSALGNRIDTNHQPGEINTKQKTKISRIEHNSKEIRIEHNCKQHQK
jgi:hypothetical protein